MKEIVKNKILNVKEENVEKDEDAARKNKNFKVKELHSTEYSNAKIT